MKYYLYGLYIAVFVVVYYLNYNFIIPNDFNECFERLQAIEGGINARKILSTVFFLAGQATIAVLLFMFFVKKTRNIWRIFILSQALSLSGYIIFLTNSYMPGVYPSSTLIGVAVLAGLIGVILGMEFVK